METFSKFLLGSIPDGEDCPFEIQGLPGHTVIEIHNDTIIGNFLYGGVEYSSILPHHGECPSDFHKVLSYNSFDSKCRLWKLKHLTLVIGTVSFLGKEGEGEIIAFRKAVYLRFELREEHMGAMNIVKRMIFTCPVGNHTVDFEFIGQYDHFIFFYFHPAKYTFENANVGIIFDMQLLASSAVAIRLFQRSMKFPVMSISRTG